jgi:hypothetical protein
LKKTDLRVDEAPRGSFNYQLPQPSFGRDNGEGDFVLKGEGRNPSRENFATPDLVQRG